MINENQDSFGAYGLSEESAGQGLITVILSFYAKDSKDYIRKC